MSPVTRDGSRVFKIGSVDSFMDELQRLTRCVRDGDLTRLLDQDPAPGVKMGLAARQSRFLADALATIAGTLGVSLED